MWFVIEQLEPAMLMMPFLPQPLLAMIAPWPDSQQPSRRKPEVIPNGDQQGSYDRSGDKEQPFVAVLIHMETTPLSS